MRRWPAAVAALLTLVACEPQAPPNLRPYPLPQAQPIVIPIIPICDYGASMTWTVTPPAGVVPAVAWYDVIDQVYGPHRAGQLIAGVPVTVQSTVVPWQLFLLTPDNDWAPVSGIVVNRPPLCV